MAILWSEEIPKERSASGKFKDGTSYKRAFFVRTDSMTESLVDISNAPGIGFQDEHPDDPSALMKSFDIKPADDSGLLYVVSYDYAKADPGEKPEDPEDPENPEEPKPGSMEFRPPVWGGASSVVTEPIYKDKDGEVMTNSAKDPLGPLEAERAEEKLTLTQYYPTHTDWMGLARQFTNAINKDNWNGGTARQWKCQGCSKKLNIENKDGETLVYWEITWEFAYRADRWTLKPWDIGFAELVDENGNTGTSQANKRRQIKGQDGKPVRQPVALNGGAAKPAGQAPDALEFYVYSEEDFLPTFGEVFTPGA